jgi:tetratricopeptide (TPR) repeat protein
MKKLFFTALLLCVVAGVYGQKKVLKSAEKAFKKGEYAEALILAEQCTNDPETKDEADVYTILGKSKLFQFQADQSNVELAKEAYAYFLTAIEKGDDKVKEDLMASPVLNAEGVYLGGGDGIGLMQELLNRAGNASFEKEEYAKAHQYFSLSADSQENIILDFYAGYSAYSADMNEEALKYYGKVIESTEEFDNTAYAYNGLIDIYLKNEDLDNALTVIKKAQSKYPEDKLYKDYEIDVLIQADKLDEAIDGLKRTISDGSANEITYYTLSYLQWSSDKYADALASALKAIELKADYGDALFIAGSAYFNQGAEMLKAANEIDDNKAYEAKKQEAKDKFKLAMPYFEKCIELKPDDVYSMNPLSTVYDQLDMDDKRDAILAKIEALEGK